MTDNIRLIVGLGNPGPQYAETRHNAGFWQLEALARAMRVQFQPESKFYGQVARLAPPYGDTRLLMPATFMNRSGQAVGALSQFFKLAPAEILVVHDELDLPPGIAKLKTGGGHGGHNGLKDITRALGNNNQFHRLRLGIGHPGHRDQVTPYVLGKPPATDRDLIEQAITAANRGLELTLKEGLLAAKQYLHSFKPD